MCGEKTKVLYYLYIARVQFETYLRIIVFICVFSKLYRIKEKPNLSANINYNSNNSKELDIEPSRDEKEKEIETIV